MLCKLPDIDIPAVTNILHAEAFLEFKQHVERPAREGQDLAAYTCWMHAVEIRHSPFVTPITSESELFPPLVKMPCCKRDCQRCAAHLGGSKFPWFSLAILGGCDHRVLHAPTRRTEILSYIIGQARRLIPRCVITQSSGKQRVIDNGVQ